MRPVFWTVLLVAMLAVLAGSAVAALPRQPGEARSAPIRSEVQASVAPATRLTTAANARRTAAAGLLPPTGMLPDGRRVVLLAWNDLGMHCYNADFSSVGLLPPYNNLVAQVVARGGEDPAPITRGVTLDYYYPDNTYSAGVGGKPDKTNFWRYARKLFGVNLATNIGLTGNGLAGTMKVEGNHFVATGIPVTDQRDQDAGTTNTYPYQVCIVTARDANGTAVAQLQVVTPVSTELHCDNCHGDKGSATRAGGIRPTGNVYDNILSLHDQLNASLFAKRHYKSLMSSRPVLCARCHSDNALGKKGIRGIPSLSNAMHKTHATVGLPNTTEGCQNCHPGPQTKCLRDVHFAKLGYGCPSCHGTIANVARNRNPWLSEPRCDNPSCHKNTPAAAIRQSAPLYRNSTGHHGGILCEACHDSTHALATSVQANDQLKFKALQGDPSYLHTCAVCHGPGGAPEGASKAHGSGGD